MNFLVIFVIFLATSFACITPGPNKTEAVPDVEKRWFRVPNAGPFAWWPNKRITWCFDPSVSAAARTSIAPTLDQAWALWLNAGVNNVRLTPDQLVFQRGTDAFCASADPLQVLTITTNDANVCSTTPLERGTPTRLTIPYPNLPEFSASRNGNPAAVLAHEIGHVWGLLHEHQRGDFWSNDDAPGAFGQRIAQFNCENLADYERFSNGGLNEPILESTLCRYLASAQAQQFSARQWLPFVQPDTVPQDSTVNLDSAGNPNRGAQIDRQSIMLYGGDAGGLEENGQRRIVMTWTDSGLPLPWNPVPSEQDVQNLMDMYPPNRQDTWATIGDAANTPFPTINELLATPAGTSTSNTANSEPSATGTVAPGQAVAPGDVLRILPAGDSITVGFRSSDGNGYRLELQNDLSADKVVFAGTESGGSMPDGWFGAWSGKTISYIATHIGPSLQQRPNIILLHAGTNDMNANPGISTEGNDPNGAAQRLGDLIDQMIQQCPDAVILVAQIINTCDPTQEPRTQQYQDLIPDIVEARFSSGHHVMTVDFRSLPTSMLHQDDCVHPTDDGYRQMGDIWYNSLHAIPKEWINPPVGPDPNRTSSLLGDLNANGGPDPGIPPPNFGQNPVQSQGQSIPPAAALAAGAGGYQACSGEPVWQGTGQIASGVGKNGAWQYKQNWISAGQVAAGLHLDSSWVRLADMDGDGKADYLWVDPNTGALTCWLNKLPAPWTPAGSNNGIIASGAGTGASVFFADMNGDGLADYLVVDQDTGSVTVFWNGGPDDSADNGWRFNPGGIIATGVPHANWETLRFADINGDGRADYVIVGEGGSLALWLNTGQPRSYDIIFEAQGGIATGASSDITNVALYDIDGDGRDDYLIWDEDGGLSGFLNVRTQSEGVPFFASQDGPKSIAEGIGQKPSDIRLADLDGDGKVDYAFIDPSDGAIWLWYNRGSADTSMAMDGLRFADIDGDGVDDYISLDAESGAPIVYLNRGPQQNADFGWIFNPLNGGNPIASGAAPANQVQFGDIDGDGKADYLVVDPVSGALTVYINGGSNPNAPNGWAWNPIGQIASGLGKGGNANVRFADIDGDGRVEYIYLSPTGGATIYRNQFSPKTPKSDWISMPGAAADGIGRRPEEISFYDIDGDGKADYVWTNALDGSVSVWLNKYPAQPAWQAEPDQVAQGFGTSGQCTRWAYLQATGRADYIAVDPNTAAIAASLNGCDNPAPPGSDLWTSPIWIETDIGATFTLGEGDAPKGQNPTPFTDEETCAVTLTYANSTVTHPPISIHDGNGFGCKLGSNMTFSDPVIGDVSIDYGESQCGTFGSDCDPILFIDGAWYDMWNAPNCNNGKTCKDGTRCYDYYRCAFHVHPRARPFSPPP